MICEQSTGRSARQKQGKKFKKNPSKLWRQHKMFRKGNWIGQGAKGREIRDNVRKKKKSEKRYKRRHKQGVKQIKVSQQHTHPAQMLVGVQNLELQLQEIPTIRALLIHKSLIYLMTGEIDLSRFWWTLGKIWNDSFVKSLSIPTFFPPNIIDSLPHIEFEGISNGHAWKRLKYNRQWTINCLSILHTYVHTSRERIKLRKYLFK